MAKKNVYTIIIEIFVLLLLFKISGCEEDTNSRGSNMSMLTKKKIIEIANKEAVSHGFKINIWTRVFYDVNNKEWKEHYKYIKQEDPNFAAPFAILENVDYQTVQYSSRIPQPGGILWIFIDKKTGKIITVLEEG